MPEMGVIAITPEAGSFSFPGLDETPFSRVLLPRQRKDELQYHFARRLPVQQQGVFQEERTLLFEEERGFCANRPLCRRSLREGYSRPRSSIRMLRVRVARSTLTCSLQ